ncbi:unnamed protein product [Thelazia callipaeda]|uniref:Ig-like domain-containing protein n=1 Tax=Thelazia callipaeda TaxID=103827 RepID=A0A0N5CYZ2_THECL|nr:unnamed protein product [Thelazia callipaeda]
MEQSNVNNEKISGIQERVVQVPLHEAAYLHCVIPHLHQNMVAWTRLRDEALLTAGQQSFTTDPRFQISLKPSEADWMLIIRRTEKSDSGCYLCEVNTEPKSTVYAVYLNVFGRTTNLMANMVGNEVLLNCTIIIGNETNSVSNEVEWWRDGQLIDFRNSEKYISKVKRDSHTIIHILRILSASSEDDGSYSCKTLDAPESTHLLHVNTSRFLNCFLFVFMSFQYI